MDDDSRQNQGSKWWIAYLLSVPLGAVALPAWCFYRIANDPGDQGGPGGWLFVAVFAALFGAIGGSLVVAFLQLVVQAILWFRNRDRHRR